MTSADYVVGIGNATELELASRRDDGALGPYTTMWVVRVHDDVYVRSAGGPGRAWYRHALARGVGRVRAGGVEADVIFEDASATADQDAIDAAYHAKYDRYGPGPVGRVTARDAHSVTVRLVPDERATM
jgi:hypothetical protein